jgi:hypothetical protein
MGILVEEIHRHRDSQEEVCAHRISIGGLAAQGSRSQNSPLNFLFPSFEPRRSPDRTRGVGYARMLQSWPAETEGIDSR